MHRRLSRQYLLSALGTLGAQVSVPWQCNAASADSFTMRMSVAVPISDAKAIIAVRFAAAVARRSNGQLKIEVYPSGQLASEQESLEGLTTGTVDLTIQATALMSQLFPQYQVLDAPFLFKNLGVASRILHGPIGEELFALLESRGILGLGWGSDGFRELETTSKAIAVPDDMRGLRMRVQNGAVYPAMFQALGAIPVVVDASEVYTALSQHTIDAVEFPIGVFTPNKLYLIAKHVAMTNHVLGVVALMGSRRKIEALPAELQRMLKEEARALVPLWRSTVQRQTTADLEILKGNGVTFSQIDYPAFRRAMASVYASFRAKLGGDLIDGVSRATGAGI
jgi:TRAP-type transport system periplasmic protein